ncbi:MAG: C25 family cysteine peptidase, partial [bacterium]
HLALPLAAPLTEKLDPLHVKTDDIRRAFLAAYQFEYERQLSLAYGSFDFVSPASGVPMVFHIEDCTPPLQPTLLAETSEGELIDWNGTLRRERNTAQYTAFSPSDNVTFHCFDVRRLPSPDQVVTDQATNLHSPRNSADVLVISHAMFIDPVLDPWLQWRKEQGYRIQVVDVQNIYDEWNNGQPSCQAIKEFLAHTLLAWQPPLPQYVIFIGDASWDHRDNQETGILDLVPSYVPEESPEAYASDIWYVHLFGGPNDMLPEMILGRISVRSIEELGNIIEKVLNYEKNPEMGPWRARSIFVNDDTYERDAMETVRESVPPAFENVFVNQADFPHVTSPYLYHLYDMEEKYCPACTEAIIQTFDRGGLLLQYFGHGGNQMWSHERIFMGTDRKLSEVLMLAEHGRLPLVANWSCLTGYLNYNHPPFHVCLSEELLRQPRKGAIVVWSPSDMGSTELHKIMSHYLVRNIGLENLTIAGDAIEGARLDFSLVSNANDLLLQYILFGDPLVRLSVPTHTATLTVEPERVRHGDRVTLAIRGTCDPTFSGIGTVSVLTDSCHELATAANLPISSGGFSCQLKVRVPLETEHLRVRLYGISHDGSGDISGGALLQAALPDLAVEDLRTSVDSSTNVNATWTVANRSFMEAPNTECRLQAGLTEERLPVASLPANATVTMSWQGAIEYPSSIEILVDSAEAIRETNETNNQAIAKLIVGNTASILPMVAETQIQPKNPSDGADIRISIPFSNLNPSATAAVSAWLVGLPSGSEQRDFVLHRTQNSRQVWNWNAVPVGNHLLPLMLAVDDLPPATVAMLAVSVSEKPDLAFTQGTLKYEPGHPILGQSIYLTTRLYNIGNAPAYNVQIAAYDGPKEKNQLVKQFRAKSYTNPDPVPVLEPGDGADIRIRWDMPGFRGLGPHDITIVADPKNFIPEIDETNNEDTVHLTIHDLPDLVLDPWDDIQYLLPPGLAEWGRRIPINARAKNMGESAAKYIRMSFLFNGEEHACFFPEIKPGVTVETQTALPTYRGKNVLELQLDRYDLIAEKDETGQAIGNNLSKPKYLYLSMTMPQAPEQDGALLYRVEEETEFSAGIFEYAGWLPRRGLGVPSTLEDEDIRLQPEHVVNSGGFSYAFSNDLWYWVKKHTCFTSPLREDRDLELRLPAPNGKYEVSVEIFSNGWVNNATGEFFARCQNEPEFRRIIHHYSGEGYMFQPLGLHEIENDEFSCILRSSSNPNPTSFYRVRYKRPDTDDPVAAGYPSALFPAGDFGRKRATLSWDAVIPEGTDLSMRARWWESGPDGIPRSLPWPRLVPGSQGNLEILGKGAFIQFYALFTRHDHGTASPVIRGVTISIEPN